jgi:hypothetical protein
MRPLTIKEVAAITVRGTYWVSRNLYVQVTDKRTKSWLFRYMKDGVSHGMGLGSLELVTLAEARDKALLCRKMLLDGIDPLEERRSKRTQALLSAAGKITFRSCAERYIEAHAIGWKNGAPSAVDQYFGHLRLPGDRRSAGSRSRHRPGHEDHRTDLADQDRDGVQAARPD